MADRIANLATSNLLVSYLSKSQRSLNNLQYQVTTQNVSADYKGISKSSQYLLSLEAARDNISGYKKHNETMSLRLSVVESTLEGMLTGITDFKSQLSSYKSSTSKSQLSTDNIQQLAFNSLLSMQAYINTSVGGRFVFSGGRVDTVPMDLGLTNLADFQAKFNGSSVTYPTTRAANIENFTLDRDSSGQTNWLTFLQDGDGNAATSGVSTITSTTAQFSNVTVGSAIEVTGTGSNNGTYTVTAVTNGGTTIEIGTRMLTDEANNTTAVLSKPANNVAQADKVTLAGGVGTGDIFSVTLNGITLSATAGATDTLITLRDNILGQINAHATLSPLVTATANGSGAIDLVSDVAGVPYTVTASATDIAGAGAANTNTVTSVTENITQAGSTLDATDFTDLTFDRANNRITVGAASLGTGALSSLTVGSKFTVSGTAQNDGTYTVAALNASGNSVDIVPTKLTDEGTAAIPTLNVTVAQTFTVNTGDDTISAAAGTYSSVKAGMKITIAGTASNNGTFTVTSVASDGSSINVRETLTAEAAVVSDADIVTAKGTIASQKLYFGDELPLTHRLDEHRKFEYDINGIDPAFEKAMRAMAIIAQGAYGSEGGLDQNTDRIENAIYLLNSAYTGTVSGTPPYGTELTSNIRSLLVTTDYQNVLIEQTTSSHTTYAGFLETQIANIKVSDPLETITKLLDEKNALEASYETISRVRELSLVKFLR